MDFQLGNTDYQSLLGLQKLLSEAESVPQQHNLHVAPGRLLIHTSSMTGLMLRMQPPTLSRPLLPAPLQISREQFSLMHSYPPRENLYG